MTVGLLSSHIIEDTCALFLYGMKKYSRSERVFILCRLLKRRDLPTQDPQQVQTSRKKFTKFVIARD